MKIEGTSYRSFEQLEPIRRSAGFNLAVLKPKAQPLATD